MNLAEILEALDDVSLSMEMERTIEMAALTKPERKEARRVKRKLRKERRKLEKEVEKSIVGEKPKFVPPGPKMLFIFGWFLTAMAFVEAYLTFAF